jgi:hypothetical protein
LCIPERRPGVKKQISHLISSPALAGGFFPLCMLVHFCAGFRRRLGAPGLGSARLGNGFVGRGTSFFLLRRKTASFGTFDLGSLERLANYSGLPI